jgi:N-acetyl sugar amidotransferase
MSNRPYQLCERCVMDTSAPDIVFDESGSCNYCSDFLAKSGDILHEDPALKKERLESLVSKIKKDGKNKSYDCVVGVSGGVDSSWVLVKTVEMGLRPLAVHMDNGWNSELAQNNISNLVKGLGLDLFTHVIDWEEYRGLMQAFFDADVVDIELLYDNAMLAVNFQLAAKFGVKYILSGFNQSTEGMPLPRYWHTFKYDKKNIEKIAKKFGNMRLTTFPSIGTFGRVYYELVKGIDWLPFLDYFDYDKFEAMSTLAKRYGYKTYPYKHYESIFTRFYQGYILPKKFEIDKRRLHFSTLIMTEKMNRDKALKDLDSIPYPSVQALEEDIQYFLKKMQWDKKELDYYISRDRIEHEFYGTEEKSSFIYLKLFR